MAFLPVLTAAAMREADRRTGEEYGLPGFTLMETAGRAVVSAAEKQFGALSGKRVVVVCGKGNNGGDGLVIARVLYSRGAHVYAFALGDEGTSTESTAQNLRVLRRLQAQTKDERLVVTSLRSRDEPAAVPAPDLVVDALLGTGVQRDLEEPVRSLVAWMNAQPAPVLAVDVPTGLDSDTGLVRGAVVRAALTVTMGALKTGLLINRGPACAGRVEVAEIGIPDFLLNAAAEAHGGAVQATDEAVRAWLPRRPHDAHKYSVGLVLAIAGARGLTGAPVMASLAAARSGAGAVVCACPASAQPIVAQKLTEVMTLGLPETGDGSIAPAALEEEAFQQRLKQARALLVGCGLGKHPETQEFVRTLLARVKTPVVLDADGLNALAGHTDVIAAHAAGRWVLTPHAGEFKRLAGEDVDLTRPVPVVRTYAQAWNCVVILKGMPSVVGLPDGRVFINATGGPALATAGTGDVLAGMCAGLLAQGVAPDRAAVCALHVGGAAADRYAARRDARTLLATDLLDELPHVLFERFS